MILTIIAYIVFLFVSFFLGLSLFFNILTKMVDEEILFKTNSRAILVYFIGIIFSFSFCLISSLAVCAFQRLV